VRLLGGIDEEEEEGEGASGDCASLDAQAVHIPE